MTWHYSSTRFLTTFGMTGNYRYQGVVGGGEAATNHTPIKQTEWSVISTKGRNLYGFTRRY